MKNPLITVFCSLICCLAIPATSSKSVSAQTYFPPKQSKEYRIKAEKNLREQISKTETRQPDWNSKDLLTAIDNHKNGRSSKKLLQLACQTPRFDIALFDAANKFSPPLCGSQVCYLLMFVDQENKRLDNYLASLLGEEPKPIAVSKGPLEAERRKLVNEYKGSKLDSEYLAVVDHLVIDGASEERIEEEIAHWREGLEILAKVKRDSSAAEPKPVLKADKKKIVREMRALLGKIESAFRDGKTSVAEELYWEMLKKAKQTETPAVLLATAKCYRTFLLGVRRRSVSPNYVQYSRFVEDLHDKLNSNN